MSMEQLLEGMSPSDIAKLMSRISERPNVRKVDHTRKLNSIKRTNLYFSSCPKPHQVNTFQTYTGHADSIREQVLAGGINND